MADGSDLRRTAFRHAQPGFKPRGGPNGTMASREPSADEVDFFPTPPWGARAGAELILRLDPDARSVWECACGAGHMAHGLDDYFARVVRSDAYLYDGNPIFDFLSYAPAPVGVDWIVTNPPFVNQTRFIRLAWARARRGVAMLMRLATLEGVDRHGLLYGDVPLSACAPFSERLPMHKGRYDPEGSTASAYAWFFFLKPPRSRAEGHWRGYPIPPGTRDRLTRPSDAAFAVGDELFPSKETSNA